MIKDKFVSTEEFCSIILAANCECTVKATKARCSGWYFVFIQDGDETCWLSESLIVNDLRIPMLFKTELSVMQYVEQALDNYTGGL